MVVSRSKNPYRQHQVIKRAVEDARKAREALCDPNLRAYSHLDNALTFELEYSLVRIPFRVAPLGM